ncbi:hypothetical protein ACWD1W_31585 [Streptomyces olivaceoviridis]
MRHGLKQVAQGGALLVGVVVQKVPQDHRGGWRHARAAVLHGVPVCPQQQFLRIDETSVAVLHAHRVSVPALGDTECLSAGKIDQAGTVADVGPCEIEHTGDWRLL